MTTRYEKLFVLRHQIDNRLRTAETLVYRSDATPPCAGGAAATERQRERAADIEAELEHARALVDQFAEAARA